MSENIWPELSFKCSGGGGCVIVERLAGAFVIRDSKNPYQPGLVFSAKEYAAFRRRVKGSSWPRMLGGVLKLAGLLKIALQYVFG